MSNQCERLQIKVKSQSCKTAPSFLNSDFVGILNAGSGETSQSEAVLWNRFIIFLYQVSISFDFS